MFRFTALSAYKLVFMVELLIAFFIYALKLRRRKRFALRAVGAVAICLAAAFLFPVGKYNALYSSFMFLCLFAVSVAAFCMCFDEPFVSVLFCGIAAYTTRHLAFQVYSMVYSSASVLFSSILDTRNENGIFNIYGDEVIGASVVNPGSVFWALIYTAIYISVYAVILAIYGRRLWATKDFKIRNVSLMALSGLVLLADIILHSVLVNITENYNPLYTILMYVYNILCCIFTFYMQFSLIDMKKIEKDLSVVEHLLLQEREQYERTKENIELINLKCHDMKYQIRRGLENADGEYIREITELISIYDSSVKTGNEDLDVILTEKSLKCRHEQITFTCMADGEKLGFMDKTDIYGLFGNLVDNAVEAVLKLTDENKKIIELSVHGENNMLAINVHNYYDGDIVFGNDGLLRTTKRDAAFHGFGMKSIRMIVDKYNGDLAFSAKDGVFNVKILLIAPCGG